MVEVVADGECVSFLQWALPQLGRRWEGYRKVRRRVCRKIARRAGELGLASLADYRRHLQEHPDEWPRLDRLTDVTISRFYRDRSVFDFVLSEAFPLLVKRARETGGHAVRAWSTGCANGEEPYTLALMWDMAISESASDVSFHVLATDIKSGVLQRAIDARYPASSIRDLPARWRDAAFDQDGNEAVLRPHHRRNVSFHEHDIRHDLPDDPEFDLVLCRYQAFTYFDEAGQRRTLDVLSRVIRPGAVLVLGRRETLPPGEQRFRALSQTQGVFERIG